MRQIFRKSETDDPTDVDITPMLDVVFIMLIFFIVTATFVKEAGIDVSRPPDSPPLIEPADENILVQIDGNDQAWVNNRATDQRSLRPNIERLHAENPEASVVIQTHIDSSTGQLIAVMDASRQAGVFDIAIADQMQ